MKLFSKNKKPTARREEKKTERPAPEVDLGVEPQGPVSASQRKINFGSGTLKGFYVSEKATGLASFNQYVFKVFNNATKNEVKKDVERGFGVKVKGVKMINLPRKMRTMGRRIGFKPGFKKAVVVLEKGHTIEQAKP